MQEIDLLIEAAAGMSRLAWRAFWSFWMWHILLIVLIAGACAGVTRGEVLALPLAVLFSLGLGASWGLSAFVVAMEDLKRAMAARDDF